MVNVEIVVPNNYNNEKGPRSWKTDLHALPSNVLPAYLHALTPEDSGVTITTSDLHNPNYNTRGDYVIISFATANAPNAYNVAQEYKRRGKTVIFGGVHVNSLEKIGLLSEAEQFSDSVCLEEADIIWPIILGDILSGKLKKAYGGGLADLSSSPILMPSDRVLLKTPNFFSPFTSVRSSEGCPNRCNFCSVYKLFGDYYRFRELDDILHEIENIPSILSFYGNKKYVSFTDDNLLGKKSRGMSLLEKLAERGDVAWIGGISSDLITEEIADLLAASGAVSLFIGFDKFSGDDLIGKHRNRYANVVKLLHDRNIGIEGSVIVGHDTDTPETFQLIHDFMIDNKIEIPSLNILTAYPGTDVWTEMSEQGRLLFPVEGKESDWQNWAHYTTEKVNISGHPHMSEREIFENYIKLWKSLTSTRSIMQRFDRKMFDPTIIPNIVYNIYLNDGFQRKPLRFISKQVGKLTK